MEIMIENTPVNNEFTNTEKIIYDLLFSNETIIYIDLDNFCLSENRIEFKTYIKDIIKRGKLIILNDRIVYTDEKVLWKLEIKR